MSATYAGDIDPREAWRILGEEPGAILVDVRTDAEWNFVGIPDLSSLGKQALLVAWQVYPGMARNAAFVDEVAAKAPEKGAPLLFICRSGARSRAAAEAMTAAGYGRCYNVATGFEGDLDGTRHRGAVNGWKVQGLPWAQA